MTVFTTGYEGLDIDSFMALLAEQGIDTVVGRPEVQHFREA